MVIFAIAAATDTLDGRIARMVKGGASELGAALDSIADSIMVCVIVFAVMPKMDVWGWLWIIYVSILLLKIFASTGVGFIRFKEFVSLHTISFKALVVVLFFYPFLYVVIGSGTVFNVFSAILAGCGLLVVAEEIAIISTTKRPERNIKSIFGVKAANIAASTSGNQE